MGFRIMESGGTGDGIHLRRAPFIATQNLTAATGTSAQSSAFNAGTRIVTIQSDEACYILFGANPTAVTATGFKVGAGETHDMVVTPGHKVAYVS